MAALPGLNFSDIEPAPQKPQARTQSLSSLSEYRFEVPFTSQATIKLTQGNAELFGSELAPHETYTFRGVKAAVFTWHGCELEIAGECESEYVAEETPMVSYANVHFALENMREAAQASPDGVGPRVLIVGPENSGKTSLCRILTAYAVKSERQPIVLNLDPRQGLLSVPGSFTATAFASLLDVEEGWGSSPISGPMEIPVKMPLVYHFGLENPEENNKLFKPVSTRIAVPVTSRLEEDAAAKASGCIIDTAGAMSHGKGGSYECIQHVVSEFSINVMLVLGSERLFNDMNRRFSNLEDPVSVIKLSKSGGCVDRDEDYMKKFRQSQIRTYFFGRGNVTLSPFSQTLDFHQLSVYKIVDASAAALAASYLPGMDDDDLMNQGSIYEKVEPSMMMQNSLLAVTHADPNESQQNIRDSSVVGYVYVAEVDESKKKIRVLAPVSGRIPPKAMVWGNWPEDVSDLVG